MWLAHHRSSILITTLTLASAFSFAQTEKKSASLVEVGRATIHPAELTHPLQLSFEGPSAKGNFIRIRIRSTTTTSFIVKSRYDLRRLNLPGDREASTPDFVVASLHPDPSRYFRTGTYQDATGAHTLLFFMGEASTSDPCPVLGFDATGKPYKVLEREMLEVTAFLPPREDKPARIVGMPSLSQMTSKSITEPMSGPYATTYDPYAVYVLPAAPAQAKYSLVESRLYNQLHYFWAGPHSSENIFVYYNLPGHRHPFLAPASNSGKLLK